jgi:uncharacterized protein YbaP (TraB family)
MPCVETLPDSENMPFMPPPPIDAQPGIVLAAQASAKVMIDPIRRNIVRIHFLRHQRSSQTAPQWRIFLTTALVAVLLSFAVVGSEARGQSPLPQGLPDGAAAQLQEWLQGSPGAPKRGVLYEIRSGSNTVYLYGTIHLGKIDFYPMNAAIPRAVAASSRVYLETDLGDPAAATNMARAEQYPDGVTLDKKIPPTLMRKVETSFGRYGMTRQEINSKKPWALANDLLMRKAAEMGYDPMFAPDIYLASIAQLLGKQTSGLESIDEQIQVFEGISEDGQRAYLEDAVSSLENGRLGTVLQASVNAWASGDAATMAVALQKEQDQEPIALKEIRRRLLDDRNVRMADRIDSIARSGPSAFVAVGAAHLVGRGSVVELLRKKGLSVREL